MPSPAAALAAAPVATWPLVAVGGGGRTASLAQALGPGGDRVEGLLNALAGAAAVIDVEGLARATPAGTVDLPLAVVSLAEGAEAAALVDRAWFGAVDERRSQVRRSLVAAGRESELEAALHLVVLLATDRLDPADDDDVEAHLASGAQLWLLAGAVASALDGVEPDPFAPWACLVTGGWWPVGPSGGRLVVVRPTHRLPTPSRATATGGSSP